MPANERSGWNAGEIEIVAAPENEKSLATLAVERQQFQRVQLMRLAGLDRGREPDAPREPHGEFAPAGGGSAKTAWAKQRDAKIKSAPKPTKADIKHNLQLLAKSKRPGGDFRGSSADRRRRTDALLKEFGTGKSCPCVWCGRKVTEATLTQDKIYTLHQGGRYQLPNLLPACLRCNQSRGDYSVVPA